MLENWIVAGINDLPDQLPARDKFEDRSGGAWLEAQVRSRNKARKYRKRSDAEAFIRQMAIQECRDNSPSFDKLCRELEAQLPQPPTENDPGTAPSEPNV